MIWFWEYPWVETISLTFLLHTRLHTCEPVSTQAQRRVRGCVPEADTPIRGSSTARQQTVLMRTPRDGLHGGSVIAVAQHRVDAVRRPHVQLVIVTPAGEFPIVVAPLEPANFRFVPHEFAGVVLRRAHVPLQNVSIPRSAAERGAAPRQRPHPVRCPPMPRPLALVRVQICLPLIGPHREVRPALRPPHRAHRSWTEVASFVTLDVHADQR